MVNIFNHLFEILWSLPAVLIAITIHEYAHGFVANYFGDPTAKLAGRLTLNPIAHLDPIGTLMLLLFRIGWAKPVPVNYNNLNNPKQDMIMVSLAGPVSNVVMAFIFALFLRLNHLLFQNMFFSSRLGLKFFQGWVIFLHTGIFINLALAIFNLIPIPPLDGHHILSGLLPPQWAYHYSRLNHTYGMFILLLLIWTGFIGKIIFPIVSHFYQLFA